MCGIAGFARMGADREPSGVLDRMTCAIRHRGPDDFGYYVDPYVALGHRRLSIIDLAAGHQPMGNEDGTVWVVYNGEIFNHAAVRPLLERAGHHYATRSDTETILHAYEEFGHSCLERFRGMFAFALWDKRRRTLWCARDRLGIKPFYYFWNGRLFAFASEIKALLEHPEISPRLEESALPEYLAFGYLSGEQTMFSGIRKLMPGHWLELRFGDSGPSLAVEQYWDVPAPPASPAARTEQEWVEECRRRLEETVRMRLMSDVPLGMFLSGGVDSSAIAGLMKRMVDTPIKTFSVGYTEAEYSELDYARQVAAHIGSDHHEVQVGMTGFFNALPKLVWHEDEPITWPSSVSLYFVSKLASSQVKVVLTGEGSDELFAGYARYRFYALNQRWGRIYGHAPGFLRQAVRGQIATSPLLSASLRRKLGHTFLGRDQSIDSLYLDNFYSAFPESEQRSLFPHVGNTSPYSNYRRYWEEEPQRPFLDQLLYADQKTYLVELLMKQDQMSMAASIESRVPFLDHPFVEFAASVPDSLKLQDGSAKYIFKKAVEDLLPPSITYRKKMGFPTPLRQWLMDSRAKPLLALLEEPTGLLASFSDRAGLRALLDRHTSGQQDATDRIWRLLNLQVWGDVFLTGQRERWASGLLTETGTLAAS
jgi:asparagine synthase (glutamine-hydrolysing)